MRTKIKTGKDILDFYGVKAGRRYKVIEDNNTQNHLYRDHVFKVETYSNGLPYLRFDQSITEEISILNAMSYEEFEGLNDKEQDYLSMVIKPFRERVAYIQKRSYNRYYNYIVIALRDSGHSEVNLPLYEVASAYYDGLILDKKYTLKELEL